jgi:hypothetical protein
MSIITLPTALRPRTCLFTPSTNQRISASPFGGSEQAVDMLNDRWLVTLQTTDLDPASATALEVFIAALRGQTNTVALHHFARPYAAGTIAGAKTLSASAAQGAASVSITATGTLLAGDMIGIDGLLLMVEQDCTASGGVITAPLVNRLRRGLSSGAVVTTSRPTATFRLLATNGVQHMPGRWAAPVSFDFGEVP